MIDYTNITDGQKKAAEEIVRALKGLGENALAESIAVKFDIQPPKIFNIEETAFYKAAKAADLFLNVQGYIVGEDNVHYSIVCINDDIRKMDKFVQILKSLD
jgi:hypothetical protein